MSSRFGLCTLLLCVSLQSACFWPFQRKPKVARAFVPQSIPVGTVTLVNEDGKFVLVDNGALPVPPVGGVLKCYPMGSESATAELLATDVRRRPFTIADIRRGSPHKGDRVIYVPTPLPGGGGLTPPAATVNDRTASAVEFPVVPVP